MDLALYFFLRYKINEAPKNFKNRPRPLFRPKTDNACHQKPSISWNSPFKIWSFLKVQNYKYGSQFDSLRSSLADWKIYITTFFIVTKTVGLD